MVEKTVAFRKRRAADSARWRERLHRGAAVYPVEVDATTFDLMERFGGLKGSRTGDRQDPAHYNSATRLLLQTLHSPPRGLTSRRASCPSAAPRRRPERGSTPEASPMGKGAPQRPRRSMTLTTI